MSKKKIYPVLISLFVVVVLVILLKFKNNDKQPASYQLKERKGALAGTEEYIRTRANAAKLKLAIQEDPDDTKSILALSSLYIQEARVTGDYMYYNVAAMELVNNVLTKDPDNFDALTHKALLYLSEHHFSDALITAEKAKAINPYNAFIYGVLVDASVEMGDYEKAVEYSDSMVSIRPDMRSYSRISYLREIHGDYPGSIEAMKFALDAGMPGDEGTAWVRVQLAHLYEKTGDLAAAEMHYTIALDERPHYAYAIAGLARMAGAKKDYPRAIGYFLKADSLVTDYVFKDELVDIYRLAGQNDKATLLAQSIISEMTKDANAGLTNDNIGHYADRELAYAYLKINDVDNALKHALAEYNRRPKNIDVNETLAWVYYMQDETAKAIPYLEEALKTNCKNPVLLNRAGLIYTKAGDKEKAKVFFELAGKRDRNIAQGANNQNMKPL